MAHRVGEVSKHLKELATRLFRTLTESPTSSATGTLESTDVSDSTLASFLKRVVDSAKTLNVQARPEEVLLVGYNTHIDEVCEKLEQLSMSNGLLCLRQH